MNVGIGKLFFLLAVLVALLVGLSLFAGYEASLPANTPSAAPQAFSRNVPPPQPIATALDMVVAQDPHGFQLLVSYTDRGFEPSLATARAGDTVRFTNNSHEQLWVAAAAGSGAMLYPAVQNGCGSSALDSCKPLKPGEYWEFTFGKTGTWGFQNNLNKADTGAISVR